MVQFPDDVPLCSTGDVLFTTSSTHNGSGSVKLHLRNQTVSPCFSTRSAVDMPTRSASAFYRMLWSCNRHVNDLSESSDVAQAIGAAHADLGLPLPKWPNAGRLPRTMTYHLVSNSDLYLLKFASGALTLGNLAYCLFAFSYSIINLPRSGDQQLDRHFRLVWEAMPIAITSCVVAALRFVQHTSLVDAIEKNAEILRKTSALGAKYCGLIGACVWFSVNLPTVITIVSVVLGFVTVANSVVVKRMAPKVKGVVVSVECH